MTNFVEDHIPYPLKSHYQLPDFDDLPVGAIFKLSPYHFSHSYIKNTPDTFHMEDREECDTFIYNKTGARNEPIYWKASRVSCAS
jgi:hypothetical protein